MPHCSKLKYTSSPHTQMCSWGTYSPKSSLMICQDQEKKSHNFQPVLFQSTFCSVFLYTVGVVWTLFFLPIKQVLKENYLDQALEKKRKIQANIFTAKYTAYIPIAPVILLLGENAWTQKLPVTWFSQLSMLHWLNNCYRPQDAQVQFYPQPWRSQLSLFYKCLVGEKWSRESSVHDLEFQEKKWDSNLTK